MTESYYISILDTFLNEDIKENSNILIYIGNYFNPYEKYGHIIKKKNLTIYILSNDLIMTNKFKVNIKGEECENNFHTINKEKEIINIKFDIIILFHLFSYEYFENKLKKIVNIIDYNSDIYIYCSLSNEKDKYINIKNIIRKKINEYSDYKIGSLLSLQKVLKIIQDNYYILKQMNIFKKNNYFIYGNNNVYKLHIKYNK